MPHIVDQLIEERATRLMQRPLVWRLVRSLCYPLLGYRDAVRMADTIAARPAAEIFEYLSGLLDLDVRCEGLEHVPARGLAFVTPNHPAGIADGIAVYDALGSVRRDITFFANRDAIRVAPGLADMIVPVEWVEARRDHARNRETVQHMAQALRQGRLIVIFPSGRLARPTPLGLRERPWQPTAFSLAARYAAPVVPMHIRARNSWLYYCLYALNEELKNMTLFRELLNKHDQPYRITIGEPFEALGDPRALAGRAQRFVTEDLPRGVRRFETGAATPG
ncbi:MAG: 1-acyl-sn-glycerol-3-phosphate acyltransferase [Pseudomonadales bacterium]|nr:1-acyl-sn-glycerol-3-phosphate acyltransferase [Pseudomonadales bacterium]